MITGDSPLTIVHVAKDAEFIDRDALVLDLKENPKYEVGKLMYYDVILHTDSVSLDLEWRNVKEISSITVDPSQPIDESLLSKYNIRMTGAAVKQFEGKPSWKALVQHNWVLRSRLPSAKGVHPYVPRVTGVHHAHGR